MIRLVIKILGSIFAQVFRCTGAFGYHLVRASGTLEANFYLKGQFGVLFSGLGEGSVLFIFGHTAGLRHLRHSNGLLLPPVGKDVASKKTSRGGKDDEAHTGPRPRQGSGLACVFIAKS